MSAQQKQDFREIYNRLRRATLAPGDSIAGARRKFPRYQWQANTERRAA